MLKKCLLIERAREQTREIDQPIHSLIFQMPTKFSSGTGKAMTQKFFLTLSLGCHGHKC